MELMFAGFVVFFGIHAVPMIPPLKQAMVLRMGEMPYKGVFSLISLAGLALIVLGKSQAPFEILWFPDIWWVDASKMLMMLAFILVASAYIPSDFGKAVKHPMLAGVGVWAIAHLMANGDLASSYLFCAFLAYAILAAASGTVRGQVNSPKKTSMGTNLLAVAVGGLAYALVGFFHEPLFGVKIH